MEYVDEDSGCGDEESDVERDEAKRQNEGMKR
jgi:hypothetical protein